MVTIKPFEHVEIHTIVCTKRRSLFSSSTSKNIIFIDFTIFLLKSLTFIRVYMYLLFLSIM